MSYILMLHCGTCGEEMRHLVLDITQEDRGVPVINLAMTISGLDFHCHNCGGGTYLGDIEEMMFEREGKLE